MRSRSHKSRVCLGDRPFHGSTIGASLYVGTPDAVDIRYRRLKPVGSVPWFPVSAKLIDIGADSIPRTLRVAHTLSPTGELTYTLPPELIGVPIACQVRTFANDLENETIFLPVLIGSDGGGEQSDLILGTAEILPAEKLDAGGVLIRWNYYPDANGVQPTDFALVQTSGPGLLPDTLVTALVGYNAARIDGLTDAAAYAWRLEARNGATVADLGSVTFTADGTGPAGTITLTVVPD